MLKYALYCVAKGISALHEKHAIRCNLLPASISCSEDYVQITDLSKIQILTTEDNYCYDEQDSLCCQPSELTA